MTKKIVRPVQSKDIAIGERIKVENLSKPIKDFLEEADKEQKELDESMKEAFRQRDERKKREQEKKNVFSIKDFFKKVGEGIINRGGKI